MKRPAIEAREQQRRLHRRAKALQSRQLVLAECCRVAYVQYLALHARVRNCNNSAATRERFAATDSETSAAAEQAADATTKTSGAQQVSNASPDATTHKAKQPQ